MEQGFEVWRHRSVVPVGLITAGLITASAVIGLPGRTEQNAFVSSGASSCCDGDFCATNPCLCRDGPSP